ncbi:MAG: CRISPR-associated ring nuclease Csm6 [Verrucomicrobiae bacterium]|nr:CRISPR-associated ring nuclease Csm6 [Verrucomicrobiae bacterium]
MKPKQEQSRPSNSARKSTVRQVPTKPTTGKQDIPIPDFPSTPKREIILFAVTGMSPAVLTETVWALAHPAKGQDPIVPDRVVVVTTLPGKLKIDEELFTPTPNYGGLTVWQALRKAILGAAFESDPRLNMEEIRVISRRDPKQGRSYLLEDIRTPADNEVAADFILEELRKLTENPDTQIIASLAGGRKTMSALLYAAMSLLGRDHDRLTHVLVSEPFDDPALKPRFYFPSVEAASEQLHQHPRTSAVLSGADATLWLADVPFVRLRHLFPKQLGRYPGKFSGLVRAYLTRIEEISGPPEVSLDPDNLTLHVGDAHVRLTAREFALYAFLAERCRDGKPPLDRQKCAADELKNWINSWAERFGPGTNQRETLLTWRDIDEDDIRKKLSSIRQKFRTAGLAHLLHFLLPQPRVFGIRVRLKT